MNVRFHPLADDEYLSAIDWYFDRRETVAAGFVREIEHAIQRIGEAPARYPVTRGGRGNI
jgi:plasmid stabilization system protein ParE